MKMKRFVLMATLSLLSGMLAFAGCGEDPAAKGHEEHVYEWTVTKEATCREEGEEKGVCECGDETTRAIPRKAHQLDESTLKVTTEPTCYSKGAGTEVCSVCGSEQPVEIPTVPHDLSFHQGFPATCAEDGQIDYWECSLCGRYFIDEEGKQDAASLVLSKEDVPHQYVDGICIVCKQPEPGAEHRCVVEEVAGTEATCKDYGQKKHYVCKTCGKIYLDESATTPVSESEIIIEPTNDHKGELNAEYHTAVPSPDCLTYGIKEHWDCKVCGKHFKSEELKPEEELIDIEETEGVEVGDDTLQDPKSTRHVMEKHEQSEATCVSYGWKHTCFVCSVCSVAYTAENYDEVFHEPKENAVAETMADEVIEKNPNNHVNKDKVIEHEAKEPDRCGRDKYNIGYKELCYECPDCGKLFHDEEMTNPFDSNEEAIAYKAHGEMEEIEAVDSTCMTRGNRHAWRCTVCNERFEIENPTIETLPLSEDEFYYDLAPHTLTLQKSDSRGHWNACSVQFCTGVELNDDGTMKIEPHEYDGDDTTKCIICNYGNVDFAEFFKITVSREGKAKITGFEKGSDGVYEILKTNEGVLRIPEYAKTGEPVVEIADDALSSSEPSTRDYKNIYQQVTSIVIPNSITKIGDYAFSERAALDDFNEYRYIKSIVFESGDNVVTIGEGAFQGNTVMTELVLPKKVSGIPKNMVTNCYSLEKLTMPQEVVLEDGQDEEVTLLSVFSGCSSLRSVDLFCLSNVKFALNFTFANCSALEEVYLPSTLSQLLDRTFLGCTNMKRIYFGGTDGEWDTVKKDTLNDRETAQFTDWRLNVPSLSDDYKSTWLHCGYTPNNAN